MRHGLAIKGLTALFSLIFLGGAARAEEPVMFGNEMVCDGPIEGSETAKLQVALRNADSERTSPPTEPIRHVTFFMKSALKGGRWFAIRPAEAPAEGQILYVTRQDDAGSERLFEAPFGAKVTLSSAAPKLDILNPSIKFEIVMSLGESNQILQVGYFALRTASGETVVAPELVCHVQATSEESLL